MKRGVWKPERGDSDTYSHLHTCRWYWYTQRGWTKAIGWMEDGKLKDGSEPLGLIESSNFPIHKGINTRRSSLPWCKNNSLETHVDQCYLLDSNCNSTSAKIASKVSVSCVSKFLCPVNVGNLLFNWDSNRPIINSTVFEKEQIKFQWSPSNVNNLQTGCRPWRCQVFFHYQRIFGWLLINQRQRRPRQRPINYATRMTGVRRPNRTKSLKEYAVRGWG